MISETAMDELFEERFQRAPVDDPHSPFHMFIFREGFKAALNSLKPVGYQIRGGKMNERLLQPWEYELSPEVQKWKSCCVPIYIMTEREQLSPKD